MQAEKTGHACYDSFNIVIITDFIVRVMGLLRHTHFQVKAVCIGLVHNKVFKLERGNLKDNQNEKVSSLPVSTGSSLRKTLTSWGILVNVTASPGANASAIHGPFWKSDSFSSHLGFARMKLLHKP